MRRRRGGRGIAFGRLEAAGRQRRKIITVNQIMEYAGMLRLLGPYVFQNPGGFELSRVGLVLKIDRFIQRQGVKDGRLDVLRISEVEPFHRFFVSQYAGAVIEFVGVLIKKLDSVDVVPLALSLGTDRLCPFNGRQPAL